MFKSQTRFSQFSITVSILVATMKNINYPQYLGNPELLNKLEEKLPRSIKIIWGKIKMLNQQMGYLTNLNDICECLKSEVKILMSVNSPS